MLKGTSVLRVALRMSDLCFSWFVFFVIAFCILATLYVGSLIGYIILPYIIVVTCWLALSFLVVSLIGRFWASILKYFVDKNSTF